MNTIDILVFFAGLLPGFIWLLFYLKEDLHPEPRKLIALTFFMGIVFSLAAFLVQVGLDCLFRVSHDIRCDPRIENNLFKTAPPFIVLFALIEEFAKFAAAYLVVRRNKEFDEPVDAMIYMVVASLGFATLENVGAVTRVFPTPFLDYAFGVAIIRFVGATVLHTLSSALVGYYWAQGIRSFGRRKLIWQGILVAGLLHASFNLLTMKFGFFTLPVLLIAGAAFFVLTDFDKLRGKAV